MARTTIMILLIMSVFSQANGQKVELIFTAGMASYSMRDLKTMNADLRDQLPFNSEVTDNFPMTLQFGGQFAVQMIKKYKLGVLYAFNSTGSRISSGDYSGSYLFDNVVNGHTIGILNGFLVYDHKAFRIDFLANIGMVISSLKMKEELTVADTTVSTSTHFRSAGIFLEPRAELSYQWKYLKAGFYLGYFINPMGRIRSEDGQELTSTINWSGLRFGIEIGFRQAPKSSKEATLSK